MFRATCLAMFWRLCGIFCCLSTKHSDKMLYLRTRKNYWNIFVASWRRQQQCLRQLRPRPLALLSRTRTRSRSWRSLIYKAWRWTLGNRFEELQANPRGPNRLTQCCTQFKSPGVKILCVLYLHYNVQFTFKLYLEFLKQNVWFPKGLYWV